MCGDCRHSRRIDSSKGSTFWLCNRSATDSRRHRQAFGEAQGRAALLAQIGLQRARRLRHQIVGARIQPRAEDTWTSGDLFALRFATSGLFASHYPKRTLEVPPEPGTPPPAPAFRPKCSTVIDVELRHGIPALQPTFELRRLPSS